MWIGKKCKTKNSNIMVIAHLNGQLGNQMFVYATAYALAKKTNDNLSVYKFEFDLLYRGVGFHLGKLMLDNDITYYKGIPSAYYKNTCYAFINKISDRLLKKKVFVIKNEEARIDYLNEAPNTYTEMHVDYSKQFHSVEGFRQSPLYFEEYRLDLIKQFRPNYSVDSETSQYIKIIQKESYPVSLHIRRGDYVKIGCCLSMSYYVDAIRLMKGKHPEMSLFIFSDDIEWVKSNLDVCGVKTYFISHNHSVNPFDDIWAMSKCKSNIIANSSFSWWGAYLNTNEDKLVIAPRKILDNNNKILPSDWIMIND